MAIAQSVIFYSWQSDLPNSTNRGFIHQALSKAAKTIQHDISLDVEPVIDRDTEGVPGSPDISRTIFSKIDQAQVFVCDISIINQGATSRLTPNPNVLLELGYALKTLEDKRIIMVLNDVYGVPELLPFDLRTRRVIRYHMHQDVHERADERKRLEGMLEDNLRIIFNALDKPLPGESIQPTSLAKQVEARFQSIAMELGGEKERARINATILLQGFLHSGYEQFYTRTFDLAVANLRLPRISNLLEEPSVASPLTPLSQALIMVFKEAFPLARLQHQETAQSLDATDIQLDNAYLVGADLKRAWMPRASLRKADLTDASLEKANLREADLSGAKLKNTDLSQTILENANLSGANLSGVLHFKNAKIEGVCLTEANLSGVDLSDMNLSETNLSEATLNKTDLSKTNLSWATLSGIDFRETQHFKEAILVGAHMTGAICPEMDLSGLNLARTTLNGAYLYDANLSRTNLWRAHLQETNLEDADLREANLEDAKLLKTNLEGADLRGANLEGAIVYKTDFTNADLTDLDLTKTREFRQPILTKAILEGANLSGLDFSGTNLSEARFSGANLYEADLEHTVSLERTDLRGVKGLTKEQREFCKARGALVDEDPTISSSQPTIEPHSSSYSNDAHPSSAQENLPISDASLNSAAPPSQDSGS